MSWNNRETEKSPYIFKSFRRSNIGTASENYLDIFRELFEKEQDQHMRNGNTFMGMPSNIKEYINKDDEGLWQSSSPEKEL